MAVLHAIDGPLKGRTFKIPEKERVVVGRYEIYDLILPDPSLSRKHFAVEKRADGLYIVDLGSLNGTQLNGHRVSTAKLEQGDRIVAGESLLSYDETDGAPPPAAPAIAAPEPIPADVPAAPVGEPAEPTPPAEADAKPLATGQPDSKIEQVSDEDIVQAPVAKAPAEAPAEEGLVMIPAPESAAPTKAPAAGPPVEPPPPPPTKVPAAKPPVKEPPPAAKPPAAKPPAGAPPGSKETQRTTAKKKAGGDERVGRCSACGRKVMAADVDSGEAEKVPQGYVCSKCVARHKEADAGTSLEQFVIDRKRRRRRR